MDYQYRSMKLKVSLLYHILFHNNNTKKSFRDRCLDTKKVAFKKTTINQKICVFLPKFFTDYRSTPQDPITLPIEHCMHQILFFKIFFWGL